LMLSRQEEEHERRAVLQNDQRLREQQGGSTYIDHYASELGGRYSSQGAAQIIGSNAGIASAYPACSPALAVQLPDEPPLGLDNPALEPPPPEAQELPNPASAVAPFASLDVERRGAGLGLSPNHGDPTGVHFPSPPDTTNVDAGSPPAWRRF
jgi:hypothetical protein